LSKLTSHRPSHLRHQRPPACGLALLGKIEPARSNTGAVQAGNRQPCSAAALGTNIR
jgi:hypothetical protein